jgi:folate-dependent phosphoribosylglycinamide formyltransferase PurN
MGIVIITMAVSSKLAFAANLHQKTNGAVELIIVEKPKQKSLKEWVVRGQKAFARGGLLKEAWYAFLLRLAPQARQTLEYFREPQIQLDQSKIIMPKIVEVDSVNSTETHELLKKLAPDLLVVWGSKILKPYILETAKKSINLHIGRCPDYKGTLANQYAVLSGDFSSIGATIHYIVPQVDAGDIISIINPDFSKKPKELFQDLFQKAQTAYADIAARLYAGEEIPGSKQALSTKKILKLEEWTPQIRYAVAKQMHRWGKGEITMRV